MNKKHKRVLEYFEKKIEERYHEVVMAKTSFKWLIIIASIFTIYFSFVLDTEKFYVSAITFILSAMLYVWFYLEEIDLEVIVKESDKDE